MLQIEKIYLSVDSRKKIFKEEPECITDVVVEMRSGERFLASFFCFSRIWEMKKEFEESGKFLHGSYFWAKNMILVDKYSERNYPNNCRTLKLRKEIF